MAEYKKILFPIDVNDAAPKVAEHVKQMVTQCGAELHVLFVSSGVSEQPGGSGQQLEDQVIQNSKKKIMDFMETNCPGLKYEAHVMGGMPEEAIVKFARTNGVQMIVMGTHGRTGFERLVSGSVTNDVIKKSDVPVFVVKPFKKAG